MDKKIQQPKYNQLAKTSVIFLIIGIFAICAWMITTKRADGKVQNVLANTLTSAEVFSGHFTDKLRLRGSISPQSTIYLDAIAGGRIEEKLVEQGQYVIEGQPLVRLSNVSLQLDVMSREAQVTEQLNFLRNTQMAMTTNRLNLRRDLLEIALKISHLKRKIKQFKPLVKQGVLAKDKLEVIELDLIYYQQRQTLTSQRQQQEEDIRQVQVKQLEESAVMLQKNLLFARNNLNNLLIKAPVSGYLSELNAELGESKSQGARLGQIDIPKQFKLMVNVDEYYLNQISLAMKAQLFVNDETVDIKVTKIDSRVRQAQFRIELALPPSIEHIKRGQSLELDLMLSKGMKNSLLVKRGAFVNNTGGNWAFVLNDNGTTAERRLIKLGKKNKNYFQIIEGLTAGERVITSNYNAFNRADIIKITGHKS
ncbi:MAG: HlyD family efflux transporter periplasmic adaptor subunit [Colwellia sp.]|nr:HlyD family efflux transporter periplasmic adaptor subunit [Colwellia sp.]